MLAADLVRLAELIMLAAQSAKLYSTTQLNGEQSRITELATSIYIAAEKLAVIGRQLETETAADPDA